LKALNNDVDITVTYGWNRPNVKAQCRLTIGIVYEHWEGTH